MVLQRQSNDVCLCKVLLQKVLAMGLNVGECGVGYV